jgi:uncharacterized RDD family membrane protein YckC
MTQQDETGQYAATDQAGPSLPSPYLDASEAAPQAYLAPPRPDQPKYGTPPPYRSRLRTDGSRAHPYAQPGYGRQPDYGQPGNRQVGSTLPRDPALAAPWERLAASFVDWIIIYAASALPYLSPLTRIERGWQAMLVSSKGHDSPALQAAVNNLFRDPSTQHVLLYWTLTLLGLALMYFWVQQAAWGATVGKRALGLRVVRANDQARVGVKTAGIRAVAFLLGPAMLWLWFLGPAVNLIGGLLWTADAGMALVTPRAQCLHDRLAGTVVMRKRWLDKVPPPAGR